MSIASPFSRLHRAALAALMMLLAIPLSAHASQDIFVKFNNAPDLQGEVSDKPFAGAIGVIELSGGSRTRRRSGLRAAAPAAARRSCRSW